MGDRLRLVNLCLYRASFLLRVLCRWWSKETVAVVTGANKGIGFALVKRLAELGLTVVLTSRDVGMGKAAVESLDGQGLHVAFCHLDVAEPSSIVTFAAWLERRFGGLDILVSKACNPCLLPLLLRTN